jgi:O-6-methylguanine DNA methyltransferase
MLQNEHAFKTKYGWVKIAYSKKGITALQLPVKRKPTAGNITPPKHVKVFEKELIKYFSGKKKKFSSQADVQGYTAYQKKVWAAAKNIPYGETRSYSWIARKTGKPGSARAAGNALGKNPCPVIIPCHRVIKSDGTMGGFSVGRGWKSKLLSLERSK